jgi:hypothetical protein
MAVSPKMMRTYLPCVSELTPRSYRVLENNGVLPMSPRESRFSIAYSHPYMNPMTWR